jgi:hypothetical protein
VELSRKKLWKILMFDNINPQDIHRTSTRFFENVTPSETAPVCPERDGDRIK